MFLMSLETAQAEIVRSQNFYSMRSGKSGRGWSWLSSVEFETKLIAKRLTLSDEDEIASRPLIIVSLDDLLLLRILQMLL